MVVRLAFALVTAVEPDLLIVDEALAVGDQHFQKKCMDRINQFRSNGCSILFCSHSLYHVRQLCDQSIWLEGGRVSAIGDTDSVLGAYGAHVQAREKRDSLKDKPGLPAAPNVTDAVPDLLSLNTTAVGQIESLAISHLGAGAPALLQSRDLVITVTAQMRPGETPSFALMLEQSHGVGITSIASHAEGARPTEIEPGRWRITLTFPDLPLHSGDYVLSAYLFDAQGLVEYDTWYQHQHFRFIYPSKTPGLVRLPHRWS